MPSANGTKPKAPVLLGVLLCSASAIAFEITLTRVFTISLWHHFAFMVLSIAMLGLGLSGTALALRPSLGRRERLGDYALAMAASAVMGFLLTNYIPFDPVRLGFDLRQALYVFVYYIALGAPFFFFGLLVSSAFSLWSAEAPRLYGADLLGAGAGSVGILLLLGWLGPGESVFAIASLALLGAAALGRPRRAMALLVLIVALPLALPQLGEVRLSEYKGLKQAMRFPGAKHLGTFEETFSRVDVFRSPMVRHAPGLSLRYLDALPEQLGVSVDGGSLTAITAKDELNSGFLRYLPSALPYEIRPRKKVLVIDPGGGLQVLLGRAYGADKIVSVESNPLLLKVIRDEYGLFSGGIYNTNASAGLGRSFLAAGNEKFDLIDISRTSPVPSLRLGLTEDYSFTVEAVVEYLRHLSAGGVLSVNLFLLPPPRAEFRVLSTGLRALEELGVSDPSRHLAAIRTWGTLSILFKATPLEDEEVARLKDFASKMRFDLVYYPGIGEEEANRFIKLPESSYYRAFQQLIVPSTREAFLEGYVFDVREVRDSSPFFHNYLKLGMLGEAYELVGRKWQFFLAEGYLLHLVLLQAVLLSLLILALPALFARPGPIAKPRPMFMLSYFCLLGLGFMFVEVPLIQAMILPLENPSYAVAAILASVLSASGAGSLLAMRFQWLRSPGVLIWLALIVLAYALVLQELAGALSLADRTLRFPLVVLATLPAGLLMGIPLPLGIRLLGARTPSLIPWAWAANGCFSVMAPLVAALLAETAGFRAVMLLGALAYAVAYLVLRRLSGISSEPRGTRLSHPAGL